MFLLPIDSFVIDVEHQASCYFFQTYTWIGILALIRSPFDYRTDSAEAPLGERALLAGVTAVGKATTFTSQLSWCNLLDQTIVTRSS